MTVEICGPGRIAKGVGELIIAVLAQVADMERQRIRERTVTGRELARASLTHTGKTHRGKESLGRPVAGNPGAVRHGARNITLASETQPNTSSRPHPQLSAIAGVDLTFEAAETATFQ